MFISDSLEITDSVLAFDEIMEEIEIGKYLKPEQTSNTGRPGYNRVNMLKSILFGFMDTGYVSLRELEDRCKVNIRYMYLMDNQTPSYRAFGYFINDELLDSVERIFQAVMQYIQNVDAVDLQHLYIDGSKFEANANKYSWVWKRGTEKSRYRLYEKITALLKDMNNDLQSTGIRIETNTEYAPEYLHEAAKQYTSLLQLDETQFVHGRGNHKSIGQRHYEKLMEYASKLTEYVEKINICGSERNSYAKTDHDATFMRMKKDYMGNDQLLPAYNVQIGVADEYIAVVDVMQYRSDMDCFVPLMEKFQQLYGFYPKYPVADAGYGSFNNYLYCQEVLDNLESIHGAFLRMNFGILKYDRWYKRVVRKGMNSVKLEIFLVSIGHNLYKLHNKRQRIQVVA